MGLGLYHLQNVIKAKNGTESSSTPWKNNNIDIK